MLTHRSAALPFVLLPTALLVEYVLLAATPAGSYMPAGWPVGALVVVALLASRGVVRSGILPVFALGSMVILSTDRPLFLAAGFAAAATLDALVVSVMLGRLCRNCAPELRSRRDLGHLLLAVVCGAGVAAVGHGSVSLLSGVGEPWLVATSAFLGHGVGHLLVLPLLLSAPASKPLAGGFERWSQGLLVTTQLVVLLSPRPLLVAVLTVFPLMAWIALRSTFRTTAVTLLAVGTTITVASANGLGVFDSDGRSAQLGSDFNLLSVQVVLGSMALITLPLAVLVSELRRTADQAAAQREHLDQLIGATPGIAIVAADADGRITRFNPGAERLLGYRERDVLGRSQATLCHVEEIKRQSERLGVRPDLVAILTALGSETEVRAIEWEHRRRDGVRRLFSVNVTTMRDEDGRVTGHLTTAEDVTERVEAEHALRQALEQQRLATEQLSKVDAMKTELVSTVSHELRTPVANILGYTEVLADGAAGELTPDQARWLEKIERNTARLLQLVDNLLTLSQIESSVVAGDRAPVSVDRLVDDVVEALQPMLATRSLAFIVRRETGALLVEGDGDQLRRCLANLLTNAVKFTPDGGRVTMTVMGDAEAVTFRVIDTGIGISLEDQRQLFTRFFRSRAAYERQIPGTGLGLYISRQIIEQHGGTLTVQSAVGAGTVFEATLPRNLAVAVDAAPSSIVA